MRGTVSAALLLALAACETQPVLVSQEPVPTVSHSPALQEQPVAKPAPKPRPAATRKPTTLKPDPVAPVETIPADQMAAITPPAIAPSSVRVVGQSAESVRARLGAPINERSQGPARIWRYLGNECAVEVYFYLDTARGDFFALDQRLSGAAADAETCLGTVQGGTRG
ncbi:hypothetical protein ACFSM5_06040 [Lacibacterium aquatile]|uniref:Outer membrane protein assembly factor BamE n=1 Tax=Lacibacterium aquatile TaxID=1168082 RepID=A0ABW5DN20_9PROT